MKIKEPKVSVYQYATKLLRESEGWVMSREIGKQMHATKNR